MRHHAEGGRRTVGAYIGGGVGSCQQPIHRIWHPENALGGERRKTGMFAGKLCL